MNIYLCIFLLPGHGELHRPPGDPPAVPCLRRQVPGHVSAGADPREPRPVSPGLQVQTLASRHRPLPRIRSLRGLRVSGGLPGHQPRHPPRNVLQLHEDRVSPCQPRLGEMEGANVVFVVAGQDHSGMWRLVARNIPEDIIKINPRMGRRFEALP